MTKREAMIDSLVLSYKSKLIGLSNLAIAEEVPNTMKCAYCPCCTNDCDVFTCCKTAHDFIEASEVGE